MNNRLQQFKSDEFGTLEVLTIDGKPYFPASDCAKILGYSNPNDAISKHCRYIAKREAPHPQNFAKRIVRNYIPEGDLYRLIIRSKLPAAEKFERWVFDEVLPTIRQHGAYITNDTLDEIMRNPKFTEILIKSLADEREKREELEPKAEYCDDILTCENAYPVSIIAKDYGMGAAQFNALLHDLGVQYKMRDTWLLYQPYAGCGYTKRSLLR